MEVDSPSLAEAILLSLPRSLGVVLFEVISRSLVGDAPPLGDRLEQAVLQRLAELLDEALEVAEREDYLELLEQARDAVIRAEQAPIRSPSS